ncbi:hypothetical protein ATANTOWER_016109 [Ataeniobius toweri]|uniref:Uncharacterized protein n=1 Tax=Ataeniobius toweri TaxID=208326 RepID=A0ABU7BHK7_9TELE|nr:hypothetical protein [Ataeniobius toweri]
MTSVVVGYPLPDPDQGITDLLDSRRCNLMELNGPKHDVQEMLRGGQSMESIPSSSKSCILLPHEQLSCTRKNPGPTAQAKGLTVDLMAVRVPLFILYMSVHPPVDMPPH